MEWVDFHEGEHGVASLTFDEDDDVFRVLVTSDAGARLFAGQSPTLDDATACFTDWVRHLDGAQ